MSRKKITAARVRELLDRFDKRTMAEGYVVLRDGKHIGTVRIYFPKDGAGRLSAFLADWTLEMPEDLATRNDWSRWQYGWANGYGYDKKSAALGGMTLAGVTLQDNGANWDQELRAAGFTIIQAI